MRWSILLATVLLSALAGCDNSSDSFGPNNPASAQKAAAASASEGAVTDSAARAPADSAKHAGPTLRLAGRAVARCETARTPRIFVNDSAAFAAPASPAVTRVLAGRLRLRLPTLLELGTRCPAGS
jgi:hypothetical protein